MEIMMYRRWTFTAVTVKSLKTESVCTTVSRPATAVADATVKVVTASAIDASCHDSHDNATETNDYDSNEETTAEFITAQCNEYWFYHYANYKYMMLLLLNTLCLLL